MAQNNPQREPPGWRTHTSWPPALELYNTVVIPTLCHQQSMDVELWNFLGLFRNTHWQIWDIGFVHNSKFSGKKRIECPWVLTAFAPTGPTFLWDPHFLSVSGARNLLLINGQGHISMDI